MREVVASLIGLLAAPQICVPPPAQLQASDGVPGAAFGIAMDHDGNRIVVGAQDQEHPFTSLPTGAVYVYELAATTWVEQAVLAPVPPPASGYDFGASVALDGDVIAVGAPGGGSEQRVHVYRLSGGVWMEEAVLDPISGVDLQAAPLGYGIAVDVDGDTLLVGMSYGHTGSGGRGLVYVYERTPSGWGLQGYLQPSDGKPGDNFGYALALQGDTACVGAPHADGPSAGSGAAYVFTRSAGAWTQQAKVLASDGRSGDRFGYSLDLDGDGLAVGAPWRPSGPPVVGDGGGAYYYTRTGSTWQQRQLVRPSDAHAHQQAGWSVALAGEYLVLGAPTEIFTSGYFHVFSRGSAGWIEHSKLVPPGAQGSDNVARSLSLAGKRLVVGSHRFDAAAPNSGAAHVYELPDATAQPTFYCSAKIDSTGCLPRIFHVGQPSASGALAGEPYTVRVWDLRPATPGMLVYSTAGAASFSFAGGILCLLPPVRRTQPLATGGSASAPCSGQPSFDFNAWIASGQDPSLAPGSDVWLQFWYRDPGGPPGQDVGLSSAIHARICP